MIAGRLALDTVGSGGAWSSNAPSALPPRMSGQAKRPGPGSGRPPLTTRDMIRVQPAGGFASVIPAPATQRMPLVSSSTR